MKDFGDDFVLKRIKRYENTKDALENIYRQNENVFAIPPIFEKAVNQYKAILMEIKKDAVSRDSADVVVKNGLDVIQSFKEIVSILNECTKSSRFLD